MKQKEVKLVMPETELILLMAWLGSQKIVDFKDTITANAVHTAYSRLKAELEGEQSWKPT